MQQGIRLLADSKRSLIVLLLTGLFVYFLGTNPLSPFMVLTSGIVFFPILLLMLTAVGGWLPAFLGFALILFQAGRVLGPEGYWFAMYLGPVTLAALVCFERKMSFWDTAKVILIAFVISVLALFLIFQQKTGGNLYSSISKTAVDAIDNMQSRDRFLYLLWQNKLISHGMDASTVVFADAPGGWTFQPEVLDEFYKQLSARISALAAAFLPGLLTTFSIYLSSLGLGLSVRLAQKNQTNLLADKPSFSKWFIPRSAGRMLWFLAAGYLIAMLARQPVLQLAGQMMYNVFFAVFVVQGLASLDFRLKQRGMRVYFRFVLLLIMFVLLQPAALIMGLFDQSLDPRLLRDSTRQPNNQN